MSTPSAIHAVPEQKFEKVTLIQAITRALADEMERDERVLVLGEDVGVDGGVFRATDGLLDRFGPDRVMDTPLAESGIIGTSIGLAVAGFRPVAEIQFMGFIYPGLNQILAHAARMRNRSRGRFTTPIVVRMPYGGGIRPPEHHSESYESLLIHTPGLKVVAPSNPRDAKGLLISAIQDDDPVIFMEPKRIYRAFREEIPVGEFTVPLGKARTIRKGDDVTLIGWGAMIRVCQETALSLEKEKVSAEILDLRTLHPFDFDAIASSVARTGRAVIVHEAPRTLGLGAEIAALIQERLLLQLLAPVQRVTGFDTIFPLAHLEDHYLPHRDRVMAAVRKTLDF